MGRLLWLRARAGPQVHSAALAQEKSDKERWQHLADLADFALAMKDTLTNINNQSFNNFMLRIGRGHAAPGAVGGRPAALLVQTLPDKQTWLMTWPSHTGSYCSVTTSTLTWRTWGWLTFAKHTVRRLDRSRGSALRQ